MKRFFLIITSIISSVVLLSAEKEKIIKINVQPQEAAIYIDNSFIGYGYGVFSRPKKKKQVAIIRVECDEYSTVHSKFYGADERNSISFTLMQDGFYRGSASSGLVNRYMTIILNDKYYNIDKEGKIDVSDAWKLLHQIILSYFPEIEITDAFGGFMQTPWKYKSYLSSSKQMRNRLTVRDITTPDRVAFQIKLSSEVAGQHAARHGEFEEIDRLPKELEPLLEELQTRMGRMSSL